VTWRSVIIIATALVVGGALYIALRRRRSPQAYRAMIAVTSHQSLRPRRGISPRHASRETAAMIFPDDERIRKLLIRDFLGRPCILASTLPSEDSKQWKILAS
jgi:hypothetical protein